MNVKNTTILGAVLVGMLFVTGGLVAAEVRMTESPHYSSGDYFIYDVNPEGMVNEITEKYGNNASVDLYYKDAKLNTSGYEKIDVNGTEYQCVILLLTVDIKFNFSVFSHDIWFNGSVHVLRTEKRWMENDTMAIVKEEMYQRMDDFLIADEEYYDVYDRIASENTSVSTYSPPVNIFDVPIYSGKTWETATTETSHILNRYRDITTQGKWRDDETNTTRNIVERFSAVSEEKINCKAGSFNTVMIKEENGNGLDYNFHMTSNGIPAKIVISKDGESYVSLELMEYKYGSLSSNSSEESGWGLPGFGIATAVLSLLVVTAVYAIERRRR